MMEIKTKLRIVSGAAGAIIAALALFLGRGALEIGFNIAEYFLPFILLMAGLTLLILGIFGDSGGRYVGHKFIGVGIGLFILSTFIAYASIGADRVQGDISDSVINMMVEEQMKDVKRQMDEGKFTIPDNKDTIRRSCAVQTQPQDDRSFGMYDLCEEIDKEENADKSAEEITEIALEKKIRKLAQEQVEKEIMGDNSFNDAIKNITGMKKYTLAMKVIGALMFLAGFACIWFSRKEGHSIYHIGYDIGFNSTLICVFSIISYKVVEIFMKSYFMTGKIYDNPLIRSMVPQEASQDPAMQELTRRIIMKTGEVFYGWLKVAIDKAFILSAIMGAVFLVLTITFFVLKKKLAEDNE